jgi:tetratricopeptide (TPR) repeat protein
MNLTLKTSLALAIAALTLLLASDLILDQSLLSNAVMAAEEEEGRRPPPSTRQSETLSRRVYERINEVMELRDVEDFVGAREVLDEIREMYNEGRLNGRETYTMFLFYANLDQIQENYEGALANYEAILDLPELQQEILEQTWMQVGSLYYVLERYQDAIDAFNTYNSIASEPDDGVYLRIAYANYQLERYQEAIPPLLRNFELVRAQGEEVPKNSYGLLRALYLTIEDYVKAYQVVRESVILYNDPSEWTLLAQLSAQLEKFNDQAYLYYVSGVGNFLDSSTEWVTLASLLSNNDNPYGCAEMLSSGLEDGRIDAEFSTYNLTATCYRIAREDEKAVPFLIKAAPLAEDGQTYADLARVYLTIGEYENAVKAFDDAIEKGDLSRPDQLYLLQARAYLELNEHEKGIEAARKAGKDERSRDASRTWVTHLGNEKERYETLQRQRRELAQWFR